MSKGGIYKDIRIRFQESVPPSIRDVVIKIANRPLWLKICSLLYRTSINTRMSQAKLIEGMRDFIEENRIDYLKLDASLKALKEEGYLHFEERSMPDHFLTPIAVEAMEVVVFIEKNVISPIVKELKEKGFAPPNVENRVRQDVYSALK